MVDWTRDELVLVADAIRANDWKGLRAGDEVAGALSELLGRGALHRGEELPGNFRSRNSVQRKSYDLLTAVEGYTGIRTHGGKLSAVVMAETRAHPEQMGERAAAIRSALEAGEQMMPTGGPVAAEDTTAEEGGILEAVARRRERDRGLRKKKIEAVSRSGHAIVCEACGFDFEMTYGQRGAGYIEVHHVNPLHITGPTKTRLDELALLCSNCHRMCHRGPWITPTEVAGLIRNR